MHVRPMSASIEFVDDLRLAHELRVARERDRVVIDVREEIAVLLMARNEIRRVPLERSALDIGVSTPGRPGCRDSCCRRWAARPGAADRGHHAIDVLDRRRVFEVPRLVADLEEQDGGIVLVS